MGYLRVGVGGVVNKVADLPREGVVKMANNLLEVGIGDVLKNGKGA